MKLIKLLLIVIFSICCSQHIKAKEDKVYNIAVIHSYQEGYSTDTKTQQLFIKELKKNQLNCSIRHYYLNCELYDDIEEERRISLMIDDIISWKSDLIAVLDDQATYSLMACKNNKIKDIPVVFSGVNYPNIKFLSQYPNITGFIDKPDYLATCKMIENIMGKVRIHILGGDTFIDRTTWKDMQAQLKGENIKIELWNDMMDLNMPDSTHAYNPVIDYMHVDTTCVIRINADSISTKGLLWMANESFHYSLFLFTKRDFTTLRISNLFNNPGFEAINEGFGVNDYMLGGYFVTLETQISDMVRGIKERLQGNMPKEQYAQSTKEYVINWKALQKYNIPTSKIPDYYKIMYMPFFVKYHTLIVIFSSIILLFIITTIAYLFYIYKKEKRRKKEALTNLKYEHENMTLAIEGGKGYTWKFDGKYFYFDHAFCELTNRAHEEFGTKDMLKFCHPEMREILKTNILSIFKKEDRRGEYLLNLTGNYEWWEFKYNIIVHEKQQIVTGILQNIQEVKNKEEELIQARRLAEKAEMKQSFLTNMSHEIRTPLNAIAGFSNVLVSEKDLSEEEKLEFAQIIDSNTSQLIKLVGDILELSSMESGNTFFNMEKQSVHELMNSIYTSYNGHINDNVKFIKDFPQDDAYVIIDKIRMTQVLNNFLSNAIKFTEKGYVKMGYQIDRIHKKVFMYVEDTGKGIEKDEQKMIFARFYKHDEFAQGVGLGLSLCQLFVEKMNGDIELVSEINKGSRFTVVLPLK